MSIVENMNRTALISEVHRLSTENEELINKNSKIWESLNASRAQDAIIESEVNKLTNTHNALEQTISRLMEDNARYCERINQINKQHNEEITRLTEELSTLQNQINKLSNSQTKIEVECFVGGAIVGGIIVAGVLLI